MAEPYRLTAEELRTKSSTDALAADALAADVKVAITTAIDNLPVSIGDLIVAELRFLAGHAWVGELKLRQLITDTHRLTSQLAATERKPA